MQIYFGLFLVAPIPRPALKSEKTYVTILPDGSTSEARVQSCWYDDHLVHKELARNSKITREEAYRISEPEVFMTVVVPAYNEEERLKGMLEEAVEYLEAAYPEPMVQVNGNTDRSLSASNNSPRGWEILVVSDGSTDKTVDTALAFARSHQLSSQPPTPTGPWTSSNGPKTRGKSAPKAQTVPTSISRGNIRVMTLEENRGKGGAVTHGMRHARGAFVVFADADGASRFTDLGKLVEGCERVQDSQVRAVGIGSRAHLVGSEAVVKVFLTHPVVKQ